MHASGSIASLIAILPVHLALRASPPGNPCAPCPTQGSTRHGHAEHVPHQEVRRLVPGDAVAVLRGRCARTGRSRPREGPGRRGPHGEDGEGDAADEVGPERAPVRRGGRTPTISAREARAHDDGDDEVEVVGVARARDRARVLDAHLRELVREDVPALELGVAVPALDRARGLHAVERGGDVLRRRLRRVAALARGEIATEPKTPSSSRTPRPRTKERPRGRRGGLRVRLRVHAANDDEARGGARSAERRRTFSIGDSDDARRSRARRSASAKRRRGGRGAREAGRARTTRRRASRVTSRRGRSQCPDARTNSGEARVTWRR